MRTSSLSHALVLGAMFATACGRLPQSHSNQPKPAPTQPPPKSLALQESAKAAKVTVPSPPISSQAQCASPEGDVEEGKRELAQGMVGGVVGGVAGGVVGGVGVVARMASPNRSASFRSPSALPNTEAYSHLADNPFLQVAQAPLSTFSIDVDTASYSNLRRFLREGQLPPKDSVRIEELLNSFSYAYPQPTGAHPFSVSTDVAICPWEPRHRLLRVGLQGKRMDPGTRPGVNLVFLIDVSGSMQGPGRLPLVKQSLQFLLDQLGEKDQVALTVYAGSAGIVLPPTSGLHRERVREAIVRLEAGGSTHGSAGIRQAYEVAEAMKRPGTTTRVILATDGDFNVGVSSEGELVRLIETERAKGIFLTVLGYGMGNLKDATLEKLADKGNGHYAYIDRLAEARKVLGTEAGATLFTLAKDVKLQLEFNPAKVGTYRLIGYENRLLRDEDFQDDAKDAGDLGAGHSVTALYELVPPGEMTSRVDPLKYQVPPSASPAAQGGELVTVKLRYKAPDEALSQLLTHPVQDQATAQPRGDFALAAGIAAFGMRLRESAHRGQADWPLAMRLIQAGLGADPSGQRQELLDLVVKARGISEGHSASSPGAPAVHGGGRAVD